MQHHCFTEECDDVPVHFQLVLLAQQIYVWVGLGTPKMGNLCVATPTRLVGGLGWWEGREGRAGWGRSAPRLLHRCTHASAAQSHAKDRQQIASFLPPTL